MSSADKFLEVFNQLKSILKIYEPEKKLITDTPDHYYLNTHKINPKNKLPIFFAAAQIKKNYVSYHLMPVYVFPELLEDISETLKKRMQGKSCFNFKEVNEELIEELKQLTEKGCQKYRENHLV
ncbi:hypothetical protein [Paenibacillus eucommiae]|uniref:6-pyruvoyl-tetrahydropterin synthase n=1 Tax=Paenibacillus eucommiae TaxID=1355755 RepID=A0ABS4IUS5_9BACL|nr:hypothetical protein [Paenibacillus eucommiae]MBP1990611.1 6-pyruvoyl-tetrahydropterin synthase [Paenibacillus eucommiae]